ncbi:MAG: NAD-dependent epimerase/dehydratase family protein [Gemmatimonadetes bacterium]|nr:NAD-dependent epimerase/dehydratase family protein [Gemmatimonadota bacterium]
MKLLVTGGAGFIGSHVCDAFLADGHEVIALDSLDEHYASETKLSNLASARDYNSFEFVKGDVRDSDCLLGLPVVDAIVHLAARSGVRPSLHEPWPYVDVNVNGTRKLLHWVGTRGIRRVIFASSSSVYGNNPNPAFAESDPVDRTLSPYAETKHQGELLLKSEAMSSGTGIACLRIFSAYGPRQRPDLAVHKFARLLCNGDEVPLFCDGGSGRDYTFIDDVVESVRCALNWVEKGAFDVFNVGAGKTVLLREMLDCLARELGLAPKIRQLPPHEADVYSTRADLAHSRVVLGYQPKTGFPEGLSHFLKWFRAVNS